MSLELRSEIWITGRNLGVICVWMGLTDMRPGKFTKGVSVNQRRDVRVPNPKIIPGLWPWLLILPPPFDDKVLTGEDST